MSTLQIKSACLVLAAIALLAAPITAMAQTDTTRVQQPNRMQQVVPHRQFQQPQTMTMMVMLPSFSAFTTTPSSFVPSQVATFNGKAGPLKPGTSARISSVVPGSCSFHTPSGGTLPSGTAAADGTYSFSLTGWFDSGAGQPCNIEVKLAGTDQGGTAGEWRLIRSVTQATPEVKVVNDTSELSSMLSFALTDSKGSCSGTSSGFSGDHPVGMRTIGGDIQFNVRSGPLGTSCSWIAKASLLPNGVRLDSIMVIVTNDSQCNTNGLNLSAPSNWTNVSMANPATGHGNAVAGANPNGAGAPVGVFGGNTIKLSCSATATNDKAISVKVDSATFKVPPGMSYP